MKTKIFGWNVQGVVSGLSAYIFNNPQGQSKSETPATEQEFKDFEKNSQTNLKTPEN